MKDIRMITKSTVLLVLMCSLRVECVLNLTEGTPCSIEGVKGTCVTLYQCYSAAWSSLYRRVGYDYEPLPELCSYNDDNDPVYCCLDCTLDRNETLRNYVVTPGGQLEEKKSSKAWNKCMEYFQNLPYKCRGTNELRSVYFEYDEARNCFEQAIYPSGGGGVGGRDALLWEFPHMALLGFGAAQESAQWLCGGSVISERFILTAAHCSSAPNLGPVTYAGLGLLRRSDLNKYWNVYKIIDIILHPDFKSPSKYNDIALMQTEKEINFGKGLLPACLDIGEQTNYYDPDLTAPGWGRLGARKALSETLQVMDLRTYEKERCMDSFPEHRLLRQGYNHTTQMCCGAADDSAIIDTCEGDSGGPAQYEDTCVYVIVAVTSFGRDCGGVGSVGMYTRVKSYVPWIESVVWP